MSPIDLERWERDQRSANRYAADVSMYQLGRRHGWGIPHPVVKGAIVTWRQVSAAFAEAGRAMSKAIEPLAAFFEGRLADDG